MFFCILKHKYIVSRIQKPNYIVYLKKTAFANNQNKGSEQEIIRIQVLGRK